MSVSNLPQERPALKISSPTLSWRELLQMLMVLFKFRVVVLLLLSAVGGAFLGAGGWPGLVNLLLVLFTGFFAASGASALNQYWEQEKDSLMQRTERRPLVTGALEGSRRWLPLVASAMVLVPSLAVLPVRPMLTFYLLLGAFIYVAVYTIWLKPRTLLNIVIGGAAGSAAVLSGGAAVGAEWDPGVIILALLVFLWTPSHFWSLAMLYRDDYRKAGTPMLPAFTSLRSASWWVMVHTVATVIAALGLILVPALGWVYALPALLISLDLLHRNISLIVEPEIPRARRLFIASNMYLAVILLAVMLGVLIPF
ncbi:MAG: heme o synthase [Anaerolineales bacterium]|nr:heme o synthase [Anaerolineales bacterium]